jgi:hypothetical protein
MEVTNLKLLATASLIILSSAGLYAQTAPSSHVGYAEEAQLIKLASRESEFKPIYAWAREIVTVRFDPNSSDMAKKGNPPPASSLYNHDGKAFAGFVRSTPSESYYENVVNDAQRDENAAGYRRNVKSGKWRGFVNGE